MDLHALGWNNFFQDEFSKFSKQSYFAARVASENKGIYRLFTICGEVCGKTSGKFRYSANKRSDYPVVGDWVVINNNTGYGEAIIHGVLPRKSKFSRKIAGEVTEEQIVAANIDTIFLVTALNKDFNTRRIERYLTIAWESGANPAIVLSKADLEDDVTQKVLEVEKVAIGVPVYSISSLRNREWLKQYL